MADFTQITYDLADSIATLTLSRPDKLNAFTVTMMREMISAFDMADADDAVRAVIVTGDGRAFCAGADLSGGGETFSRGGSDEQTAVGVPRDGGGLVSLRVFRSLKPVIAAINGPAVGIGATMTLPMDIRLASGGARFGFVFAARGIVPEACSSWFLPRLVGIQQALEWCYTAKVFPAAEAHHAGLVRSLHEPDELLPAARELAQQIAQYSIARALNLAAQPFEEVGAPFGEVDDARRQTKRVKAHAEDVDRWRQQRLIDSLEHRRHGSVGGDERPMTIDGDCGKRFVPLQHELHGGARGRQCRIGQRPFGVHGGKAGRVQQRVAVAKRSLQVGDFTGIRKPLDRLDRGPVRLHREHQAGAHDLAPDTHRAGAAHPVLASDMRAGKLEMFAQEVRQIQPRQHMRIDTLAIDRQ